MEKQQFSNLVGKWILVIENLLGKVSIRLIIFIFRSELYDFLQKREHFLGIFHSTYVYHIKNCQGKMHNFSFSGKFKYGDIFTFILYKTHTGALDYSDHVEN